MPLLVLQVRSANIISYRCYLCKGYLDTASSVAIKVDLDNSGYNWAICASCVDKMHSVLHGKVK